LVRIENHLRLLLLCVVVVPGLVVGPGFWGEAVEVAYYEAEVVL
jgi:ribosomal protein L18E